MTGKLIRILTVTLSFLGMLFVLQPAALADTVTMVLTQPPGGNVDYGIYLSPYYATVIDTTTSPPTPTTDVPIICDDFSHDTFIGQTWTATTSNGSTITDSTEGQEYDAIAYLALLLPGASFDNQALYSFAIWDIFDDSGVYSWLEGYGATGNNGFYSHVQTEVNTAEAFASVGERSILTIYEPTDYSGHGSSGSPQEFVSVQTPEASSLANLAVDLLLLAGAVFVVRRRQLASRLAN